MQRHYKLRPSSYLTFSISVTCLFSFSALFILPLAPILLVVMGLVVFSVSVLLIIRDARLANASSCVAFRLETDDAISLILRDGRHLTGKLGAGGIILPFVVLIAVRLEQGGYRGLVMLKDSMDANSFRRLRVVLRWGVKRQDPVSSV